LGVVETSPAALRKKAEVNKYSNQEYSLITRNCQNWAEEMLMMIDEGLVKKLEECDLRPISKTIGKTIRVTSPCSYSSSSST
jgi:hypothetical protein